MVKKLILFLFILYSTLIAQTSFTKGVNLTNWFQAESPEQIHFIKYTKDDFKNIKSLGCDVIRLPINLHSMIIDSIEYKLDPLFLFFLDSTLDWAEDLNMHIILDNHTFNPFINTSVTVEKVLIPVWKQLAEHCKERSKLIYYEILNEPHGINDTSWNRIQQNTVREIRKIDSVHTIIVGPAGWNSYNNLKYMPEYSDTNLLYTFHFYDPFIFTHQGATWTTPSMLELANIPFPYDAARMPNLPSSLKESWVEDQYNYYSTIGTVYQVKELIDIAVDFKTSRNVKIFCGEFGVYQPNCNNEDRSFWYNEVVKYFEEKEIPWTSWDYQGEFGLFNKNSYELFNYDLNVSLLSALGFNIPPQSEYKLLPDSTGSVIYSDYIAKLINNKSYVNGSTLNFYSDEAIDGKYCIYWADAHQYNNISFDYKPDKDFSKLFEEGYYLSMWIKGNNPDIKFDIRFIDTKTETPGDHPWRMRYKVANNSIAFDNQWHKLNIPLSSFSEHGSWDNNTWYIPRGEFDWKAIDVFEIVAEYNDLINAKLWFDKIEIIHPDLVNIEKTNSTLNAFILEQNYPNPFNPTTIIKYSSNIETFVRLNVYDVLGKKVANLVNKKQKPGSYQVTFNANKLASGTYFYVLQTENNITTKKMILLR
jgi:endoglucanase